MNLQDAECLASVAVREVRPHPDPTLEADMDVVESDDDDDEFPTIPPGRLDNGWCDARLACTARLSGCFAVVRARSSSPTRRGAAASPQARSVGEGRGVARSSAPAKIERPEGKLDEALPRVGGGTRQLA
jgi:hypothetical protein